MGRALVTLCCSVRPFVLRFSLRMPFLIKAPCLCYLMLFCKSQLRMNSWTRRSRQSAAKGTSLFPPGTLYVRSSLHAQNEKSEGTETVEDSPVSRREPRELQACSGGVGRRLQRFRFCRWSVLVGRLGSVAVLVLPMVTVLAFLNCLL